MSEEEYTRITHDLTVVAAEALLEASPSLTFCFISGAGADSSEKGRVMWARVKGKMLGQLSVVLNGAGAAGRSICNLLRCKDTDEVCIPVGKMRVCDSKGIIWPGRPGNTPTKDEISNREPYRPARGLSAVPVLPPTR